MIYDCFLFNNELDVLELRLNELKDIVDKFIILESDRTLTGLHKPLYFEENKNRFKEFAGKIIHHTYRIENKDPWIVESNSRNHIKNVLEIINNVKNDDILIISDADEITSIDAIKSFDITMGGRTLVQKLFYYRLNCFCPSYIWGWSKIVSGKVFNESTPQDIRYARMPNLEIPGGWHFSFIGTAESIASKIKSFAHQEFNKPEITNIEYIQQCMSIPKDIFNRPEIILKNIPIDNTFPKYLQDNIERYKKVGLIN